MGDHFTLMDRVVRASKMVVADAPLRERVHLVSEAIRGHELPGDKGYRTDDEWARDYAATFARISTEAQQHIVAVDGTRYSVTNETRNQLYNSKDQRAFDEFLGAAEHNGWATKLQSDAQGGIVEASFQRVTLESKSDLAHTARMADEGVSGNSQKPSPDVKPPRVRF